MRAAALGLALCAVPVAAAGDTDAKADAVRARVQEVLAEVAAIRQLPARRKVGVEIKGREEILGYVRSRLEEEEKIRPLGLQERLWKRLGMYPASRDLRTDLLAVLKAQIGGYYDPFRDTFVVADWIDAAFQDQVLAHELTHALQDQNFDLERFLQPIPEDQDRELAMQALAEGDGTAVMMEFALKAQGMHFKDVGDPVALMQLGIAMGGDGEMAFPAETPELLKEMLLFPYAYGAAFVQHALQRGSWAKVDGAYRELPASTEQILHPEKYFATRDEPRRVRAREVPAAKALGEPGFRTVLGQYGTYLWLKRLLPQGEAASASAGWDGDEVALFGVAGAETVVWASVWDDAAEAVAFAEACRKALDGGRLPQGPRPSATFTSPLGEATLEVRGDAVTLVLSPAAPPSGVAIPR